MLTSTIKDMRSVRLAVTGVQCRYRGFASFEHHDCARGVSRMPVHFHDSYCRALAAASPPAG